MLPKPPWHPLLPLVSDEEIERLLLRPNGADVYAEWFAKHLEVVRKAEWNENDPMSSDPLRYGFELPHWHDADLLLGRTKLTRENIESARKSWQDAPFTQNWNPQLRAELGDLPESALNAGYYIWIGLGGNRSGKSEYCAKQIVEDAIRFSSALIVCVSEDLDSSRKTQQALVWKYLPPDLKALNNKRDPRGVYNVTYSKKGGFTKEELVLPNGTQIVFKSYHNDPGAIEGWMLGSRHGRCVGGWLDESATTGWFEAFKRRCLYCGAVVLWSFTPVKGQTPAVKEAVGSATTLKHLPAELLPQNQRHVPDCPPGRMPYLQAARTNGAIVQYFWSQFNPFGTAAGTFYDAVRMLCTNEDGTSKASVHVKRIAYGYTEDSTGRKFPAFGPVHVVKVGNLPEQGTLYQFTDPHGSRPFATIWVLVTPGKNPNYYVVRDWPDERTYGEWAIPTQREVSDDTRKGWDGDQGPAQRELRMGVVAYKNLWKELERVVVPTDVRKWIEERKKITPATVDEWKSMLTRRIKYPWHRGIIDRAVRNGQNLEDLSEYVHERYMDSRFCNSPKADENGVTSLREQFEDDQRDSAGTLTAPGMQITPASGMDLEHGCILVTDLLSFDTDREIVLGINSPRLWVSEECTQVRWALENYSGRSGATGACKEWIDLLRHLAESEPYHVEQSATKGTFRPGDDDES